MTCTTAPPPPNHHCGPPIPHSSGMDQAAQFWVRWKTSGRDTGFYYCSSSLFCSLPYVPIEV